MCHELCDHSTQSTTATNTGFGNHKCAPQAHISLTEKKTKKQFSRRRRTYIRVPKVRYLGFEVSARSTDRTELQSARMGWNTDSRTAAIAS